MDRAIIDSGTMAGSRVELEGSVMGGRHSAASRAETAGQLLGLVHVGSAEVARPAVGMA